MGKNMMATICVNKGCEELCYYGEKVCNRCQMYNGVRWMFR